MHQLARSGNGSAGYCVMDGESLSWLLCGCLPPWVQQVFPTEEFVFSNCSRNRAFPQPNCSQVSRLFHRKSPLIKGKVPVSPTLSFWKKEESWSISRIFIPNHKTTIENIFSFQNSICFRFHYIFSQFFQNFLKAKNIDKANLKKLFVSNPQVTIIFLTRAVRETFFDRILTVPWAYVNLRYICHAVLTFYPDFQHWLKEATEVVLKISSLKI